MVAEIALAIVGVVKFIRDAFMDKDKIERTEINESIKPIHDKFKEYHLLYMKMFREFRFQVQQIQSRAKSGADITSDLENAKKEFFKVREPLTHERQAFRDHVGIMIQNRRREDAKLYATAVAHYFITQDDDYSVCDFDTVKVELHKIQEKIAQRGAYSTGDALYNTPSTAFLRSIEDDPDPNVILLKIETAFAGLHLKFLAVIDTFDKLTIKRV